MVEASQQLAAHVVEWRQTQAVVHGAVGLAAWLKRLVPGSSQSEARLDGQTTRAEPGEQAHPCTQPSSAPALSMASRQGGRCRFSGSAAACVGDAPELAGCCRLGRLLGQGLSSAWWGRLPASCCWLEAIMPAHADRCLDGRPSCHTGFKLQLLLEEIGRHAPLASRAAPNTQAVKAKT